MPGSMRMRDSDHVYALDAKLASAGANVNVASPGATLDGVSFVSGDIAFLKDQTSAPENGLWVWFGAAQPMLRLTTSEIPQGAEVMVQQGTDNAGTRWMLTTLGPIAPGVTAMAWRRIDDNDAWSDLQTYLSTIAAGTAAGTFLLSSVGAAATLSSAAIAAGTGVVHLDPTTNYRYPGKTHQVRVVGTLANWAAAQTGNFTFGLYPITAISAAGVPTLGAAVAAPAAIVTPANPALATVYSAPITMPATGHYCVGVVASAAIAASSVLHLRALLQIRET